MSKNSCDVAVLTVISAELNAARNVLAIADNDRHKDEQDNTIYYHGKIFSKLKKRDYSIVLGCIGGAGNPNAAVATTEVIQKFRPSVVLLMGIAAGIRNKVKIGEVVISERIVAYEGGALMRSKDGIEIEEPRPEITLWSH